MDEYTLDEFMEVCDRVKAEDPEFEALTADGFDDAIIGAGQISGNIVVIYNLEKVYDILMSDGMSYDDAVDYYCYNIAGSAGDGMPVFMDTRIEKGFAYEDSTLEITRRHVAAIPRADADDWVKDMYDDRATLLQQIIDMKKLLRAAL